MIVLPWTLLAALLAPARACEAPAGSQARELSGSARAGQPFEAPFGERYALRLAPTSYGWNIEVREAGRDENLARLTPPWHFVPNPRELEGWHFRNASNSAPNDGSVNAPGEEREFYFSPEVGRSLEYAGSATRPEVVDSVRAYGTGRLTLSSFELTPPRAGERASFQAISFQACLVWRASDDAFQTPRADHR
jgi:hypothetical protein